MATQRPIKSLSDLMDGGVEERFNAALAEVWENVYDPNTDAKKPREVNGAWKNEAVINIHDYLKNNLYGQNIVVLA